MEMMPLRRAVRSVSRNSVAPMPRPRHAGSTASSSNSHSSSTERTSAKPSEAASTRAIVSQVPGAEYVVVEDSGHMVTLEKHEIVDAALLDLLDRVRRDIAAETVTSA